MNKLTEKELLNIFRDTNSDWDGDNTLKGGNILGKYVDVVFHAAEHDIIYGPDIDKVLEGGITREDIEALAKLNWGVDEEHECFYCFV